MRSGGTRVGPASGVPASGVGVGVGATGVEPASGCSVAPTTPPSGSAEASGCFEVLQPNTASAHAPTLTSDTTFIAAPARRPSVKVRHPRARRQASCGGAQTGGPEASRYPPGASSGGRPPVSGRSRRHHVPLPLRALLALQEAFLLHHLEQ